MENEIPGNDSARTTDAFMAEYSARVAKVEHDIAHLQKQPYAHLLTTEIVAQQKKLAALTTEYTALTQSSTNNPPR